MSRTTARLPDFLHYCTGADLIRLGKDYDGGYLVSQADVERSKTLVSLGINDDWSFDREFQAATGAHVYAYDASISQRGFLREALHSLVALNKFRLFPRRLRTAIAYWRFFSRPDVTHIRQFVGIDTELPRHCTMDEVLERIEGDHLFLKIDVEGAEYRFLDTLVAAQDRIEGLAIELHDCDIHLEQIRAFVAAFDLKLVHVHANTYGPLRQSDGLPLVLELTFSRNAPQMDTALLPHPLDMPNKPRHRDLALAWD